MEYELYETNKYKNACGKLRTICSGCMEILTDQELLDQDKVRIVSSELRMVSNNQELSYDELELFGEDYSFYPEDMYLNEDKTAKYKNACGVLRTTCSENMEILEEPTLSDENKVILSTAKLDDIIKNPGLSYEALELFEEYDIEHSEEFAQYFKNIKERNR